MPDLLSALFVLSAVASSAFFVWLRLGFDRARAQSYDSSREIDVTVIVAAHNEETQLPALLEALGSQTCASKGLHLIVVDDRSTDGTAQALREHCPASLDCTVLRIDHVAEGVSPKKNALHHAVRAAITDVLLFTDADCRPEPRWAEAMAARFANGADVVLGLSPVDGGSGVLSAYAAYEAARTAMTYIAAAGWKRPYMSVGRNWGYRRSLFERSGGLEALFGELGGDDDLLLQRFLARRPTVAVCVEAGTLCRTAAPVSFRALCRQKLRHYRAGASYRGAPGVWNPLTWLLAAGVAEFASVIVAPVLLVAWQGAALWIVCSVLALKLGYDVHFLNPMLRLMTPWRGAASVHARGAFLEFVHVIFSSVVSPLSLLLPRKW